jgi:hypothetical protein
MANYLSSGSFTGLTTQVVGVPTADTYILQGTLTLPSVQQGSSADSQAIVTVNQNSTPIYTGPAGANGFRVKIVAAANDLISIIVSSSAAVDAPLNVIRTSFAIWEGGE